jgi:hypothetical protein
MWSLLLLAMLFSQASGAIFEGHWKKDLPPDLNRVSSAIESGIDFAVTEGSVTITRRFVRPVSLQLNPISNRYLTDGRPHKDQEFQVVATWINPRLLNIEWTETNGAVFRHTYEVSEDGATLVKNVAQPGYSSQTVFHR